MTDALPVEVSEVTLAALLGQFCAIKRDLDALHEMAEAGRLVAPPLLARCRAQNAAAIEVLCDELHQLARDPAQLPLFSETNHATH